jgi:hypothetical protein
MNAAIGMTHVLILDILELQIQSLC